MRAKALPTCGSLLAALMLLAATGAARALDFPTRTIRRGGSLRGRRRHRHRGPHRVRQGGAGARPAGDHRQPAGRRRHHRGRRGGACAARRLHAGDGRPVGLAAGQSHALSEAELSIRCTISRRSPRSAPPARSCWSPTSCRPGRSRNSSRSPRPSRASSPSCRPATARPAISTANCSCGSPASRRSISPTASSRRRVTDLVTSRVSFWIAPIPTLLSQIQAGQVRPLAVAGDARSSDLPGIPTVKESGLGDFDASTTYGLFAPAGTPPEIIERIYAEMKRALDDRQRAAEAARRRRRAEDRHAGRREAAARDQDPAMGRGDQKRRHQDRRSLMR